MSKKEMVQYLTTNCDCWKGKDDKALLEKMDDVKLQKLVGNTKLVLIVNQIKNKKAANAPADEAVAGVPWTELAALLGVELNPADDPIAFAAALKEKVDEISSKLAGTTPTPEPEEPAAVVAEAEIPVAASADDKKDEKAVVNRKQRPTTDAEWLQSAPAGVQSAVRNAMAVERAEKVKLIRQLTANVQEGPLRQQHGVKLMAKSLGELSDMLSLFPQPTTNENMSGIPDFSGAAGGARLSGAADDSDNLLPVFAVNFDDMASAKLRQKTA